MPRRRPLQAALEDVVEAAERLLGCYLVRTGPGGTRKARIVETEAYPHDDPACHAFSGPTMRNRSMFGKRGSAYVYRIHRSHCLNVVTGPRGRGEAVLIRAIEPVEGMELMAAARRSATVGAVTPRGVEVANGPGKLCQALDIDVTLDGIELLAPTDDSPLYLLERDCAPKVVTSTRIGISRAKEALLRFCVADSRWVSR